jgi:hypothetical protein
MHTWGDKGVDWQGINDCAEFIGSNLRKWGRVNVWQWKEKYGTVRVHCELGLTSLYQLHHPGWAYIHWPPWAERLHYSRAASYICQKCYPVFLTIHKWLYRYLYSGALKKWPHLKNEIMVAADHPKYLKGLIDPITCTHDYWSTQYQEDGKKLVCALCQTEVNQ